MSWLLDTCVLSEYVKKIPAPGVIAWLGKVEQRFAGRILPLDDAALHAWAQLAAQAELAGKPLPVMDGLVMATAQCHGLTVVTRNVQDFGLFSQVFNPWDL